MENNFKIINNKGFKYSEQGNYDEAILCFRECLSIIPDCTCHDPKCAVNVAEFNLATQLYTRNKPGDKEEEDFLKTAKKIIQRLIIIWVSFMRNKMTYLPIIFT